MTLLTTPSVCLVVSLLAVLPMPVLHPSMSQNVTCRCFPLNSRIHQPRVKILLLQVNPTKYTGLGQSLGLLVKEEGTRGIWKGVGPTLVGYSLQGMFKYGLYEVFKDFYSNMAGEEASQKYKPAIWLAGSASAEVFADIALCPFEMTKVKIQTSPNGTFPIPFGAALKEMSRARAETRYPFGSIVPLWSRQVGFFATSAMCN